MMIEDIIRDGICYTEKDICRGIWNFAMKFGYEHADALIDMEVEDIPDMLLKTNCLPRCRDNDKGIMLYPGFIAKDILEDVEKNGKNSTTKHE